MLIVIPKVATNKIFKKVYTKRNDKGIKTVHNNKKAVITEMRPKKSDKAYRRIVK